MTNSAHMSSRFSTPTAGETRLNCTATVSPSAENGDISFGRHHSGGSTAASASDRRKLVEIAQTPNSRTVSMLVAASNAKQRPLTPSRRGLASPTVGMSGQLLTQATKIRDRLMAAVDGEYNVIDIAAATDVISQLETFGVTKEILELTRLGKHVNELRRKEAARGSPLADRAKTLVKSWRQFLLPSSAAQQAASSNSSSPSGLSRILSCDSNSCSPKLMRSDVTEQRLSPLAKSASKVNSSAVNVVLANAGTLTPPTDDMSTPVVALHNGSVSRSPKILTPPPSSQSDHTAKANKKNNRRRHNADYEPTRSEMLERQLRVAVEAAQQANLAPASEAERATTRSKIRTTEEIVRDLTRKSEAAVAAAVAAAASSAASSDTRTQIYSSRTSDDAIKVSTCHKRRRESIEIISDAHEPDKSRPRVSQNRSPIIESIDSVVSSSDISSTASDLNPRPSNARQLNPDFMSTTDYLERALLSQLPGVDVANSQIALLQFDQTDEEDGDDGFQMEGLLPPLRSASTVIPGVVSSNAMRYHSLDSSGRSTVSVDDLLADDLHLERINGTASAVDRFSFWHEVASVDLSRRQANLSTEPREAASGDTYFHILPYTLVD